MNKAQEVEKLLSLIFQSGGQVTVKDGQLWVAPVEIARKFGDQIRRLKPEILIAFGHCPVCARELIVEVGLVPPIERRAKTGRHAYCSGQEILHYDDWQF